MSSEKQYLRFDIFQRIEHAVLLVSFTTLGLTGLPQKYASAGISQAVIQALGGIDGIRVIHHIAAAIFIIESLYHILIIGYKLYVQRKEATMLPGIQDMKDAIQAFFYNLGFSKKHPQLPRYNFMEKAEYWAMLWGLLVMALTGLMLWNPITTARILPGVIIPAAKAAHGGEAVLAVLAIILWHFYNVHLKHLNLSMLRGSLSKKEMAEEHGAELAKLENEPTPPSADPMVIMKRMSIYTPAAIIFAVVGLLAIYVFLTGEKTAITTVPVDEVAQVYVPLTPTPLPPTPTPAPTVTLAPTVEGATDQPAASTWDNGIGAIFDNNCSVCHGTTAGLSLQSYADAMKGGSSGAAIQAGNPDNSLVVTKVKDGKHAGKFSADELAAVIAWIKAGAPEK